MSKITDFQRVMWQCLSYLTVCRFYVVRDPGTGNFVIKKAGKIRLLIYHGIWINTLTKVTYLILAYRKLVPLEIHFMDQMGMMDWFLCFSQIIQEVHIWYRRKLFEVLCANWKIQEDVFQRLGFPSHVEKAILKNDWSVMCMHAFAVLQGVFAFIIQFIMAPKYAANIYAVVPYDNWFLRIIFCSHEIMYVYHIWVHQVASIMLCEVFANSYTQIIREMTVVFRQLIDLGTRQQRMKTENGLPDTDKETKNNGENKQLSYDNSLQLKSSFNRKFIKKRCTVVNLQGFSACRRSPQKKARGKRISFTGERRHAENPCKLTTVRWLDPKTKVPGTEYDIKTLLRDYERMTLAANAFNSWVGKIMGGTMGSNYSQFVSDVFMIFQLMKEPGIDMLAVVFYAGDAIVGMWILFRMLIIISQLYPASEEFLHVLKQHLTYDTPLKRYLLKYKRGLQVISTKIGGYKTKSITVPKGIDALMQYIQYYVIWFSKINPYPRNPYT